MGNCIKKKAVIPVAVLFEQFLMSRYCLDYLRFYDEITNYQKTKFPSTESRVEAARNLFAKFLGNDEGLIHLETRTLAGIRNTLKRPTNTIFQDALFEIGALLRSHYIDFVKANPRVNKQKERREF